MGTQLIHLKYLHIMQVHNNVNNIHVLVLNVAQ